MYYTSRRLFSVFQNVDWSEREEHMLERHGVTPEQAEEALADDTRIVFEPDYASQSGQSVRVIGFAPSIGAVTVIVVLDDVGKEWGGSAWKANQRDAGYYSARREEGDAREQDQ